MAAYVNELRSLTKEFGYTFDGAILAGGAVTSTFTGKPIADFDVYFTSRESFIAGLEKAYGNGFWCVSLTSRAITFKKNDLFYQFMFFRFFDDAQSIFDSFDFTCCMGALDLSEKGDFILHPRFLPDAAQRVLVFNYKTDFPIASALRILKYQERGYTISRSEWLKVVIACNFKEVKDWKELQHQIGGTYGNIVAMATDKPFDLDNVIESLDKAFGESKSESEPPISSEEATEAVEKILPANAKDAESAIDKMVTQC